MPDKIDEPLKSIFEHAIDYGASDIHVEPQKNSVQIRFRVDGLMQVYKAFNKLYQETLISKLKILSNMNIADHRLPQDGHLEFQYNNIFYNIRVSSLPAIDGENVVLRILNRQDVLMDLDHLGLDQQQLILVKKIITNPSGMMLITGPTGSGKTNFLYSALHTLNQPYKNIVTLEDPVEYEMEGIRQTQINEEAEFSFEKAMRSIVRQDPDVIMLGEIRDPTTAQLAIQASLIGILVISTFHTFDVPALVTRFFEMGVTNSVVAQSIQAVISTRLIRKICNNCKSPHTPTPVEKIVLGNMPGEVKLFKGTGCEACKHTGYLGRTGVFEVAHFDTELKAAIVEKQPASYIHELLKKKQTKTLRIAAIEKVLQGISTVEEIHRVLGISI